MFVCISLVKVVNIVDARFGHMRVVLHDSKLPNMDPEEIDDEELEEIRSVCSIARVIVLKPRISVAMKISPQ